MFKNSNKVSDEKRKLVGFFILALIIIFSPYTITKLSTHGSDAASSETVMSGDGGYQKAEQELSDLSAQEKVLSESIQKADATNVVDPASSGAPDSRVDIQATQNKTTMSFYDFSDNQTEELKSDLVDQKVEGGIFYGTYDNSNNFQELSLNLTEANQLNLVVTDRSKSFLVYDLYLENADLVTDFHT